MGLLDPPGVSKAVADATYVRRSADAYRMTRSDIVAGADNRDAIQAVVTAAVADGVRRVILPPGEITLGSQVAIPSNGHNLIIEGQGDDTVIKQIAGSVNKALFYGTGTDGAKSALTSDLAAGANTVTIPIAVASTLAVGSLLGLECQTVVYGLGIVGQEGYASEIRKVVAVSGTSVTLDGPLLHDYTVAASAVAWKMTPLTGVELRKFTMTSTDALTVKARNIMIEKARSVRMGSLRFRDSGGGIIVLDTIDSTFADIEVDGLPNVGNFLGYGIAVGGRSAHVYIENLRGRNFRHLFTTLADERTVESVTTQWGGPRHVTVRGGVGEAVRSGTQYSIWDTHPYGYDIVFDQCRAYGGSGGSSNGFQIRSKRTRLINPVSMYAGNQGIRIDSVAASETEISGGEVAYAATVGVSLAKNTSVRNVWIHDNTQAGVLALDTSTGSRVSGNKIENNQYGVHDQSAGAHTGVEIENNTIPKSVTQTFALLSPKGNMLIKGNKFPGFASVTAAIGGSPGSSIRKTQNISDGAETVTGIDGGSA